MLSFSKIAVNTTIHSKLHISHSSLQEAFSVFIKWSGKDDLRVLDMDWGSSDRPLLLMSDGTVRLYNVKLNETTSPSPAHFIGEYRGAGYVLIKARIHIRDAR